MKLTFERGEAPCKDRLANERDWHAVFKGCYPGPFARTFLPCRVSDLWQQVLTCRTTNRSNIINAKFSDFFMQIQLNILR